MFYTYPGFLLQDDCDHPELECECDISLFLRNLSLKVCENATNHEFSQLGLKIISYEAILQRCSINLGLNYSVKVTQKMDQFYFPFKRQESSQTHDLLCTQKPSVIGKLLA